MTVHRNPIAIAWVVAIGIVGLCPSVKAEQDFKAQADNAVKKLSAYDFGGDASGIGMIDNLAAASRGDPERRKALVVSLGAILQTDAPYGAKDFACRQLAIIGTTDAVPALGALLADEKLSNMARYALERIPDAAADDALRGALGKAKGKSLVGILNSIGNRRDAKATGALAALLGDADPQVAEAAAVALGRIGDPASAQALGSALSSAPAAVKPAAAHACLNCADTLVAVGKRDEAAALYDRVRAADVPKPARAAAIRGAILARQAAGLPLLVELVRGPDPRQFALALAVAREAPGFEITQALASELARLPADRQVPLIQALGERKDPAASAAILAATKHANPAVRGAAMEVLGKVGDASVVPLMLDAAAGADAAFAQTAAANLATLPGKDVDAALLAALAKSDGKVRAVLIGALGLRRAAPAVPALLKAAGDPDESIRLAALKALGNTAGTGELGALTGLLIQPKGPKEAAAAEAALTATCSRIQDKEACAGAVAAAIPQAGPEPKAALVRVLSQIGGAKALQAIRAAVKDANPEHRDIAIRALCEWTTPEPAPDLLAIAKTSDDKKYKILALRGYLRMIGLGDPPADKKLAMCKEALALADRDEEKKLVLGALGGVASLEALNAALPFLDNAAMKDEAAAAVVGIAEKILDQRKAEAVAALEKALQATKNRDVTRRAQDLLRRAGKK
jgi:HEAT repeat protein